MSALTDETEWATDIMFDSAQHLAELYPLLLTHAMSTFSSQQVMRYLGKVRIPKVGVDPCFNGEVNSKLLVRPEGVCVKHRLNRNTLKMYDKQGSVLRVETTNNDARDFGVHRASESDPTAPKKCRRLRKGMVDWGTLWVRRAEISQAANSRYLKAQSAVESSVPLGKLVDDLSGRVITEKSRSRGLQPLTGIDSRVIAILLRLFRAHRLIRRIPHTHRYQLTAAGRRILPYFTLARLANTKHLQQTVA